MKTERVGSSIKCQYDEQTLILMEVVKKVSLLEKMVYNLSKQLEELKQ